MLQPTNLSAIVTPSVTHRPKKRYAHRRGDIASNEILKY
jgi:hypothetical protein